MPTCRAVRVLQCWISVALSGIRTASPCDSVSLFKPSTQQHSYAPLQFAQGGMSPHGTCTTVLMLHYCGLRISCVQVQCGSLTAHTMCAICGQQLATASLLTDIEVTVPSIQLH
jgi:hypothetical protein